MSLEAILLCKIVLAYLFYPVILYIILGPRHGSPPECGIYDPPVPGSI